jgi:hypothetical protein
MNPIVEKIKKLLRMKRGGTPDEIATALRLAQELAEKHGVDLNAVNPDEERHERPIEHNEEIVGLRVSSECQYASMICDGFFKVTVFKDVNEARNKYVFRFVGEEWDIQIAIYVYRFLCRHFRSQWKTKRGRCRNRKAFIWGMYLGLSQKLAERQPKVEQVPGVVKIDHALQRRTNYIDLRWKLETKSAAPADDAAKARWLGYLAGRQTEIRSGVSGKASDVGALQNGGVKLLS